MTPTPPDANRRSFLARLTAGTAALGALFTAGASPLGAMPVTQQGYKPERHPQDDWLDQIPGKHRIFFDTVSPKGAAEGVTFASNYAAANKSGFFSPGYDSFTLLRAASVYCCVV